MLSAPRVIDIQPQGVQEFIESISTTVYDCSRQQDGRLPYTVIREITENFIHAGFLECTVSVLDEGNTLRFADQGPGIAKKDLVLQPGVSSATSKMKDFIRGVGSGFPIVREYLSASHGYIKLEDNADEGVVVTISLIAETPEEDPTAQDSRMMYTQYVSSEQNQVFSEMQGTTKSSKTEEPDASSTTVIKLKEREKLALLILNEQGVLGPVDLGEQLDLSAATATRLFQKLDELGLVESNKSKKRILTHAGLAYVQGLLV